MQNQRLFGQIFTPDKPGEKITGVWLNIENDRIFIEAPFNHFGNKNWKVLLGEFNGLDKVTFLNVHTGGGSSGYGGSWRKLHISTIIKGEHFLSESDLVFKKITLNSPALKNWIRLCDGIEKIEPNLFKIPENKEIFSIDYEDLHISVNIGHVRESSNSSLNVEKNCYLIISAKSPVTLSLLSEIIRKIKRWVLFVTNKNPEFSEYTLTDKTGNSYELINTLRNLNEDRFTQNITFYFNDLQSSLGKMLSSWLDNEKLESIVELIQEKEYNTELSFQSYFLNMCVAIESMDYIFGDESLNNKIEPRKRDRQSIISLIDNEDLSKEFENRTRNWLHSYFRERLKKYSSVFTTIKGETFKGSTNKFIGKIVNTRNSLAHNGTYKEYLSHIELLLYGKVIEFVIKHEILILLEIDKEFASKIQQESKKHVEILARINEYKV